MTSPYHFAPPVAASAAGPACVWATQDVPRLTGEEFMADSNGVFMSIEVAGPATWVGIGRWYAGLARDRYVVAPTVRAAISPFLIHARTADDTLRAAQRWVAQDIRYVSIALGLGGYQPRSPAEVVATGYGDCKDKATLFVAVAGSLGYRAYPVLLNSGGHVNRTLPSIGQFDHAIAAVDRPTGRVYVDLTADLAPYGELPPNDQGQFTLVVHRDGVTEEVTLPESAAAGGRPRRLPAGRPAGPGGLAPGDRGGRCALPRARVRSAHLTPRRPPRRRRSLECGEEARRQFPGPSSKQRQLTEAKLPHQSPALRDGDSDPGAGGKRQVQHNRVAPARGRSARAPREPAAHSRIGLHLRPTGLRLDLHFRHDQVAALSAVCPVPPEPQARLNQPVVRAEGHERRGQAQRDEAAAVAALQRVVRRPPDHRQRRRRELLLRRGATCRAGQETAENAHEDEQRDSRLHQGSGGAVRVVGRPWELCAAKRLEPVPELRVRQV